VRVALFGINYSPEETGIAPYTTGLAEHLVSLGHEVRVVAGMPHYPAWTVESEYRNSLWRRERINGVEVHRRRHFVSRKQSALRRGLYEATFLLTGATGLRMSRPDAIIGVVPSLSGGMLARVASRLLGAPYGILFQDLMGRAAAESGVDGGRRVASTVRVAERWAVSKASAVGVVSNGPGGRGALLRGRCLEGCAGTWLQAQAHAAIRLTARNGLVPPAVRDWPPESAGDARGDRMIGRPRTLDRYRHLFQSGRLA
jgi:colanic acid biosynthesis glycosyl transferase WcaI